MLTDAQWKRLENLGWNGGREIREKPQDYRGRVLPNIAVLCGEDMVDSLLKEKVQLNMEDVNGQTPLMVSVAFNADNSNTMTKKFLDAGADVNYQNRKGVTALMCAHETPIIFELLLNSGADWSLKNDAGQTILEQLQKNVSTYHDPKFKGVREAEVNLAYLQNFIIQATHQSLSKTLPLSVDDNKAAAPKL